MYVRVLFFGVLKDFTGLSADRPEVPAGTTVGELFQRYAEQFETLCTASPSILFAKNREFAQSDTILHEDDEVAFLPPVSGGSTEAGAPEMNAVPIVATPAADFIAEIREPAGHLFALTRKQIDSERWVRELQRPEDGAVIVFEGVVRNNTKGRSTLYLDYECYQEMAILQMAQIGREIATQFAIGRVGMIHRLGRLEIGEASVSILATAPHRKPAFDAALEGINRLKREVPIWKKEHFEDGAVWVDGEWDDLLLSRQSS
ncbi:MAG: molybdenum cofactor biosynthesis protein MoaE [Bryobacteraceae bacterium]